MFKKFAFVALFAASYAIKLQEEAKLALYPNTGEEAHPSLDQQSKLTAPITSKEEMTARLTDVAKIFDEFNKWESELEKFTYDSDEYWEYYDNYEDYYVTLLTWGTTALVQGYTDKYATQEEIWKILSEQDLQTIMELFAELGGTEDEMKEDFVTLGYDPTQVDYLETITNYDIDTGDAYPEGYVDDTDYSGYDWYWEAGEDWWSDSEWEDDEEYGDEEGDDEEGDEEWGDEGEGDEEYELAQQKNPPPKNTSAPSTAQTSQDKDELAALQTNMLMLSPPYPTTAPPPSKTSSSSSKSKSSSSKSKSKR